MRIKKIIGLFSIILACYGSKAQAQSTDWVMLDAPVPTHISGEPNLFATDKNLYLSWIEQVDDTTKALVFSQWNEGKWTAAKTIAKGANWFVNWADFPALAVQNDGKTMAAHWLQKSGKGTYDYDIHVSQSSDGGTTWQSPFLLNRDNIKAEHGFVSLETLPNDKIFATWLDGRKSKMGNTEESNHDEHSGHGGAMTLRAAIFDNKGALSQDTELDERVCDCCQTAAVKTDKGMVVAYRNRSDEEVRDIYVVHEKSGQWSIPKPVFTDNWKINGCPVNGPALAANGNNVALAWFTAANGEAQVKLAFSKDAGARFGKPIRLDGGKPLGRVDVLFLDKTTALVSWLEDKDGNAEIRFITVTTKGVKKMEKTITKTASNKWS